MKDVYKPTVYGVGYLGLGYHKTSVDGKHTAAYRTWKQMLRRVYGDEANRPTYKDTVVAEEWHNFQTFADWFEDNKVIGWELDKDVKSFLTSEYSPDTCMFLPKEINAALGSKACKSKLRKRLIPYYKQGQLDADTCKLILSKGY